MSLLQKFKELGGYQKRGLLYMSISFCGMVYELIFVQPTRLLIIMLWLAVFVIGFYVYRNFKNN